MFEAFCWWQNKTSSTNFTLLSIFSGLAYLSVSLINQVCGIANYARINQTAIQEMISDSMTNMTDILSDTACRQLSQMFLAIIFFHASEFFLAIVIHGRSNVTLSSLLLSKHYIMAMICSVLEYLIEIAFFPNLKELWLISELGLILVVIGEIIRKIAILTARQSFTHLIRVYPDESHRLVTHGIYKIIRHPGYCGFFIWSIGTQILLCNPLSTVGFAVVVWNFFAKRIPYEEYYLRRFFRTDYVVYAKQVASGIPFVK